MPVTKPVSTPAEMPVHMSVHGYPCTYVRTQVAQELERPTYSVGVAGGTGAREDDGDDVGRSVEDRALGRRLASIVDREH